MLYKIHEQLPAYLIAPDGTPIHKVSYAVIPFEHSKQPGFTAKLETNEEHVFTIRRKTTTIKLYRRFTREQMIKLYGVATNEFDDEIGEVPYTGEFSHREQMKVYKEWEQRKPQSDPGMSDPSLTRSFKVIGFVEEANQITPEMMDKLKASKRTIKRNPKVTKAMEKKAVLSVIEDLNKAVCDAVNENLQSPKPDVRLVKNVLKPANPLKLSEMKVPFFRINGVHYQSARAASKALGVAVNTVLKRAKANKDGWFYIDKE